MPYKKDGFAQSMRRVSKLQSGRIPPLSHFSFTGEQALAAQTIYTQMMLEKGILAGKSFYAS